MEIAAALVKELRDKTGAGMMDCKKALAESAGDLEKAVIILRERGMAKAASKSSRTAKEGLIFAYIHPGDKLGVLVEVNCETDFVARTSEYKQLCKDIAMQIAASNPIVVNREEVPRELINREREIYRTQALNDGKPEKIVDKIVDGKLDKYYQEVVLMEQAFVKDMEKTVKDIVTEVIAKIGENIQVKRFTRYRLGE